MTETKIGDSQTILSNGTRHVSIWAQGGTVTATKFVGSADFNATHATLLRWKGKTMAGARRWAEKELAS